MRRTLLFILIFFSVYAFATKVALQTNLTEDKAELRLQVYELISDDVYASLKSGERILVTITIFEKRFLAKNVLKRKEIRFRYDIINKKYVLTKDNKDRFYDSYDQLLKQLSNYTIEIELDKYLESNVWGEINVKGTSVVGIFSLIYKFFFDLNYAVIFPVNSKK